MTVSKRTLSAGVNGSLDTRGRCAISSTASRSPSIADKTLTRRFSIAQLEAGHSNALTAYLDAMSRFHNYSFGNVLEIARQKPSATRVAVLILVQNHARRGKPYSGSIEAAIRHAVAGERPSQDWAGASELFAIAVPSLRKKLFGMIQGDTPESQLAWRCLTRIDELRDEYGPVESEPRHPDIESGRPWPIPFAH